MLGKCRKGELLRTKRHHRVCDLIAEELRVAGLSATREDFVRTNEGDSRFSDIVAISNEGISGYILDPTIRFERDLQQPGAVNEEKRQHYIPTLGEYRERHPRVKHWHVFGLMFGARGVVPKFTADVLTKSLKLPRKLLTDISHSIVKDSIALLNTHLYAKT